MQAHAMFCKELHFEFLSLQKEILTTYSVLVHNWLGTTYYQLESRAFFANDFDCTIFVISTDKTPPPPHTLKPKRYYCYH